MSKAVEDNSKQSQNQHDYQERFNQLDQQYNQAHDTHQALEAEIESKQGRVAQMRHHLDTLKSVSAPVTEFTERLWHVLVDHATISPSGQITFHFKWSGKGSVSA